MKKICLLLLGIVFLASCVGIETRIDMGADGSGSLSLTYKISRELVDLGRAEGDPAVVPLPVSREDFERALHGIDGVRLKSFRRSQDERDVTIGAVIGFASLEALARIETFKEMEMRIEATGSRHTMTQLVAKAAPQPATEDSRRMIDEMFEGYNLTYVVHAPAPITANSPGTTLSADRRTLSLTTKIADLVDRSEDLVVSLSW